MTSLAVAFPGDTLIVQPWPDIVSDHTGHDPRSPYVEQFWLAVLGPSTTWLLRYFAAMFDRWPDGFEINLDDTARAIRTREPDRPGQPVRPSAVAQRAVQPGAAIRLRSGGAPPGATAERPPDPAPARASAERARGVGGHTHRRRGRQAPARPSSGPGPARIGRGSSDDRVAVATVALSSWSVRRRGPLGPSGTSRDRRRVALEQLDERADAEGGGALAEPALVGLCPHRPRDVEMGPRRVAHELLEEQPGGERAAERRRRRSSCRRFRSRAACGTRPEAAAATPARRRRRRPRAPAPIQPSSLPITPAIFLPSAPTHAPVSVAMSTMASTPSSAARTAPSASTSRPSASVFMHLHRRAVADREHVAELSGRRPAGMLSVQQR